MSNITETVNIQFPNADATLLSTNNISDIAISFGGPISAPVMGGQLRLQSYFQSGWQSQMTAGRLASKYLSATTNTVVYSADIDSTASVMVTAANWSGGAATYRLGLRDYDQILSVSGPQVNSNGSVASTHKFAKGNPVSAYKLTLSPGFTYSSSTRSNVSDIDM